MTPEAERYLDKAQQSLAHARAILAIELGEDAGRAAYLGAFHAAQAFIFDPPWAAGWDFAIEKMAEMLEVDKAGPKVRC